MTQLCESAEAESGEPRSKRLQLCRQLQEMILEGEFAPGARLRQEVLARQFGVAQGVVREALLQLKVYGLVDSFDRRGAFVSRLGRERLIEAFELRAMHEALAVRRCCECVSRIQVRELMHLAGQIRQAGLSPEPAPMHELDQTLHARLIELSGNQMLWRLADNYRLLTASTPDERDLQVVYDEHMAILRAIETGRADDAERLVRRHIAAAAPHS